MKKTLLLIFALVILSSIVIAHETGRSHIELPPGIQKLVDYETSKAMGLTLLAVFLAGLFALSSPCGFVVLPTFLAYSFKNRKKAFLMTTAFSIGIIIAFLIFGIIASIVGNFFNDYKSVFATLSGVALIVFSLMTLFNKGFSFFTFKFDNKKEKGFISYVIFGIFFAGGWTPCIGPLLSSIFFLAANTHSTLKSIIFLITYAMGIVIPLLIISLFADKYDLARYFRGKQITFNLFSKKIYTTTYNIFSAIILFIVGLIMLIYNGTYPFETFIQTLTPWSMKVLQKSNNYILESAFFKSRTANIIGLILIIIIITAIIYIARKEAKEEIKK